MLFEEEETGTRRQIRLCYPQDARPEEGCISVLAPIGSAATILTIIAMAALGMGVDVRTVSKAGGPVTITVVLSLIALGLMSFALVRLLNL